MLRRLVTLPVLALESLLAHAWTREWSAGSTDEAVTTLELTESEVGPLYRALLTYSLTSEFDGERDVATLLSMRVRAIAPWPEQRKTTTCSQEN